MAKIVMPRWLPALMACLVSAVLVPSRPTDPNGADASPPASGEVVFRHYL